MDELSERNRRKITEVAAEACKATCAVLAPNDMNALVAHVSTRITKDDPEDLSRNDTVLSEIIKAIEEVPENSKHGRSTRVLL